MFNLVSRKPELGSGVFVAPSAAVIGSVKLGDRASVWYGTVLRGALSLIWQQGVMLFRQRWRAGLYTEIWTELCLYIILSCQSWNFASV